LSVCGGRFQGFNSTSYEVKLGCIEMFIVCSFLFLDEKKGTKEKSRLIRNLDKSNCPALRVVPQTLCFRGT